MRDDTKRHARTAFDASRRLRKVTTCPSEMYRDSSMGPYAAVCTRATRAIALQPVLGSISQDTPAPDLTEWVFTRISLITVLSGNCSSYE